MSKLYVNTKLAIPGLAVLAHAVFTDKVSDESIFLKYVVEAINCFKRLNISVDAFKACAEHALYETVTDDNVTAFRKTIAELVKQLRADYSANQNTIELIQNISGCLAGDNKHYIAVQDKISLLNKPEITKLFPIDVSVDRQKNSIAFVNEFSSEQLKDLKEQKDPTYKTVLQAKKAIRTTTSDFIRHFCREKGLYVNYASLLKAIETEGLVHSLPRGFEGYINEFGILFTFAKKQIDGFPSDCDVIMNKNYDAKKDDTYVFTAKSPLAKNNTYFYTVEYRSKAKKAKFAVVKKLSSSIDKIRSQWCKHLDQKDSKFEAAAMLELIYQTQARIGSPGNATLDKRTQEYKRTFGMSTLLRKHYQVVDKAIVFKYPGKAAFKGDVIHLQTHEFIPTDKYSKIVFDWLASSKKEPDEKVFSVSGEKARDLLKDLGAPEGASVHKLRTLKGTLMMKERIKNHPFVNKQSTVTAVNKWLKEQALDVGIKLGHMSGEKYTASTAIAHYIDPVTMLKLYREANVAPPKTMLKLVGIDKTSLDIIKI